jgi:hypothetical protein
MAVEPFGAEKLSPGGQVGWTSMGGSKDRRGSEQEQSEERFHSEASAAGKVARRMPDEKRRAQQRATP